MFNRLKIRNKILLSVLLISLITLLSLFTVLYTHSESLIIQQTEKEANARLLELISKLEGKFSEKAKIVKTVFQNPLILQWLATNEVRFVREEDDPNYAEIKKYFQNVANNDPEIFTVFVASEKSQMYYDTRDYEVDENYFVGTRPYYKNAVKKGHLVYDIYPNSQTGVVWVNLLLAIKDASGNTLGVGGTDMSLDTFNSMMLDFQPFETGVSYIINQDSSFVFHPNKNFVFNKKISDFGDDGDKFIGVNDAIPHILSGEAGTAKVTFDGKDKIFIYAPLPDLGWSIVLSVNIDEINKPLSALFDYSLIIILVSICLLVLSIFWVANLISKPIISLSNAVIDVTKRGSLQFDYNHNSPDEIGVLSISLKEMMNSINKKAEVAEKLSHGILDQNIEIISDDDILGKSMSHLKEKINEVVSEIISLGESATDGNLHHRADVDKFDGEFAQLVNEINILIDTLINPIKDALLVIEKVSERDLSQRVTGEYNGEHAKLRDKLNEAIDNLDKALSQVSVTVDAHAQASGQISELTENIIVGIDSQSNQTNDVAAAIEEMTSTILGTSQNATDMAETATKAKKAAIKGGEVVKKTIAGINKIATQVQKSSDMVNTLGKSSEQIGEIISVIEDIADQTNLLALNAAIEAARAGEQGRGFAVVADEVRKLSERTTNSTKEISEMIKNIQYQTVEAVNAMTAGVEETKNGICLADSAGKALDEIVQISEDVTEKVSQIATANSEQSQASELIAQNVEDIRAGSAETANGMLLIAQDFENFNDLTAQLQKVKRQFILSDNKGKLLSE